MCDYPMCVHLIFRYSPLMVIIPRTTQHACNESTCISAYRLHLRSPSLPGVLSIEVLGIEEYAPLDEVNRAYKRLSLVYHPDKTKGMTQQQQQDPGNPREALPLSGRF